ncbi:aspartyl protease family protein [Candidatus Roizmanbacteria bacterium]|nr:aspartyl protease family protein [Candidatus Roizmanbacteria bacterium]
MNTLKFPYEKSDDGELLPQLRLTVYANKLFVESSAILDSGASISLLRKDIADTLKIKIQTGRPIDLDGVGGRVKGYIHRLPIAIGGKSLIIPIVFSYKFFASVNLLGRAGFFEQFTVCFHEKEKITTLSETV